MTFDDIKEMQIGSKKVKEAWLNGRQVYPSEKRIMDSLVCWYDIGKQQCTNESMAANPVLADLSGNGHDIECFNFGWAGMSGIGGYVYDLIGSKYSTVSNNIATIISNEGAVSGNVITTPKQKIKGEKGKTLTYTRKAFDVKISNLPVGVNIRVNFGKNNGNTTKWETIGYFVNGINHVDEEVITVEPYDSESTPYINDCRILFSNKLAGVENIADLGITIELLPEYPNALVSDGVDDYCYTDGLPILTDYTVIAKRKWVQTENDNNDCFAAKGNNLASFLIERYGNNGNQECYSFGQYNGVSFVQEDIIYQTKESYNGYPLKVGTATDVDNLVILGRNSAPLGCIQAALYSFLLFDRTLTTAEIEWVKKNMVEGDLVLPSYELDPSLIDAWIFSGLRNEDAPASIVGEKGIELKCYNFAWNEEGSGFKDGALCFDGVDDSCAALDKLACDRNVTVIGKRRLTSAEYNQWQTSLNIHIDNSLPNILYLDYYEDTFESANGHKLKCVFGDYEYYYDNDTEPHSFWATKDAFNGQAYNNKVYNFENGLKYSYNIYLGSVWSGAVAQCEWYYFAIYDKVMTEKEAQAEIKKLEKIWSNRKNN